MPPAGLCFTDAIFKMSPLSFDNGWMDRNDEKVTTATKIGELWSSNH